MDSEWRCPNCSEHVSDTFTQCWNCLMIRPDSLNPSSRVDVREAESSTERIFKHLYVFVFLVLASTFVPVVLHYGLIVYVVPLICPLFVTGAIGIAVYLYLLFYLALFYGAARLTSSWVWAIQSLSLRFGIVALIYAGIFSCSFMRVLTYTSIQGQGGTYTFWTALDRYHERYR